MHVRVVSLPQGVPTRHESVQEGGIEVENGAQGGTKEGCTSRDRQEPEEEFSLVQDDPRHHQVCASVCMGCRGSGVVVVVVVAVFANAPHAAFLAGSCGSTTTRIGAFRRP